MRRHPTAALSEPKPRWRPGARRTRRALRWWCCRVLLGLACGWGALGSPLTAARAQTRFEEVSEAERALQEGSRLEAEAAALARQGGTAAARPVQERALARYRAALALDARLTRASARAGYVLYLLDRSAEAVDLLQQARTLDPGDADLKHILGINLFRQKQQTLAVPLLTEVVEHNAEAYFGAAFLLGKYHYGKGNLVEAERYFQKYLTVKPTDHKVHGVLGNILLKQGRYADALRQFNRVIELQPDDLRAQINVGNLQYQQANYPEAARLFERVLQRDPKRASIHYNLASSCYQLRRYPEAIRYYRSFLALRPESHSGYFYLGHALTAAGALPEALEAYGQARKLQPSHAATAYRLGLVLARLGRWEQARVELTRAAAASPDDPWPRAQLANVQRRLGELDPALTTLLKLVRENPKVPLFQLYAGESLLAKGLLDEADGRFAAALGLQPTLAAARAGQAGVLCHRARQRLEAGRLAEARSLLERARTLAPTDPRVAQGLALLLVRAGDVESGLRLLAGIEAEMKPSDPAIVLSMAEASILRGRGDEADPWLSRAAAVLGETDPRVIQTRALRQAAAGRLDAALELLEPLAAAGKEVAVRNQVRLLVRRAGELLAEGKARQARALLQRATTGGLESLPPEQALQLRVLLVRTLLIQKEYPRALELLRPLRKAAPADPELAYLEAWAAYRARQFERAWAVLQDSPALRQPGKLAELGRQLLQRQAGVLLRRGAAGPAEALLLQARALPGGEAEPLRHDLAVAEWLSGRKAGVEAKLVSSLQRGGVPEAEFNLGLIASERGDQARAQQLLRDYANRGGEFAAEARALVEVKERVHGLLANPVDGTGGRTLEGGAAAGALP